MSKKLETLGLIELTSKRQAKNGTLRFYDPITSCDYFSYQSGYIRRKPKHTAIYQLNPKRIVTIWSEHFKCDIKKTDRILIHNPNYRLELIARATVNFRKYLAK